MNETIDVWDKVGEKSGLLTDADILKLGKKNLLITKNFDENQIHQTCYELRVGEIAYFLLRKQTEQKIIVDKDNPIEMRPRDVVTIITYEEVKLPDNILGRIISKGHLFSIGLSPVITFVDPGFSGNLGITFINLSKRKIKFEYKDPISKIEFEKLGKNVNKPYRGQHNFAAKMWPIDYSKIMEIRTITKEQIKNNSFLKTEAQFFGEPFDLVIESIIDLRNQIKTLRKHFQYATSLVIGFISYFILEILFNYYIILPENIKGNILSAIISGIFTIASVFLQQRLSKT